MKSSRSSILLLLTALGICSCSTQYLVEGSTTDSRMEGMTLRLNQMRPGGNMAIDSAKVVHGQFVFSGTVDTITMATMALPDDFPLLMVLEDGDINISIENTRKQVSGSPLNESLYSFLGQLDALDGQLDPMCFELSHLTHLSRMSQMMTGRFQESPYLIELRSKVSAMCRNREGLIAEFIIDNSDNVMGPYVFMVSVCDNSFPLTRTCVERIISDSHPQFFIDPFVAQFMRDNHLTIPSNAFAATGKQSGKRRKRQ